ncbi:hypothetical protein MKW94_004137 [Papaver nudicaule]|uniref:Cupin type-1 domain-containing protein n=1 Tax=Papaver nudicaule TaxID=74823 RepID=A0AA41VNS4_PAPNU|nr:hypothetical protein [Papaver nudicaule]
MHKLPILRFLGMSVEKGNLHPVSGGRIQVVGSKGNTLFDGRVRQGDMFVVPQFFTAIKRAGENELEWVNFQTGFMPMESPIAGSTSVFKGMPLEIITNSYQVSYSDARALKFNREEHVKLVPPPTTTS